LEGAALDRGQCNVHKLFVKDFLVFYYFWLGRALGVLLLIRVFINLFTYIFDVDPVSWVYKCLGAVGRARVFFNKRYVDA